MLKHFTLALTVAAALALGATAPGPAQAGALHLSSALGNLSAESDVIDVRRHRRRARDIAIGIGVGALILGGIAAAERRRMEDELEEAWYRCEMRFQSLREDGTYTTFGGERRLCPYLEPYVRY